MRRLQLPIARILSEFPYLRSPLHVIDRALEAADLSRNDVFVDLGCGDGVVLIRGLKDSEFSALDLRSTPFLFVLPEEELGQPVYRI